MTSNNLNVAFVDQITITIGNNDARGEWNTAQQNLQRRYNTTVNIVIDPNIQGKNTGAANPSSIRTNSTYASLSVQVSGVQNGNATYADPGVIKR